MRDPAATLKRVSKMTFASIYPLYLTKILKKDRTEEELLQVITWLTGYTRSEIDNLAHSEVTLETFFDQAQLHPNAALITGLICGVRIEEIEEPLMRHMRYMDKLVDELAKGRKMEKILRLA